MIGIDRLARAAVVALLVAACSAAPTGLSATYPPVPTFPVPAEVLANETAGPDSATVTCGGKSFPIAGLEAPTGAEKEVGAEFDALREALSTYGPEFPGSATWAWRLAGGDDGSAVFLARTDDLGPPGWVYVAVSRGDAGWHADGMGQCDPKAVLSSEFGPASWAIDSQFPAPDASTIELHILVWEGACSGGAPATGRISAPVVVYGTTTVTITLGVRPLQVPPGYAVTCPGPPGTPAILRLSEPLGSRQLLDGGSVPPVPPSPMFGP